MRDKTEITIGDYPLSGIIRKVRRIADFSQRELAKHAGLSPALIAGAESGARTPSLAALQRILRAANFELVVVDGSGRLVVPLLVWQGISDGAGRRFPAHLDTILDPIYGEWWADIYGLDAPPETFRKNRAYRDWQRSRSEWQVRVKALRNAPPPRLPFGWKPGDEWKPDPSPDEAA